MMSRAVGLHDSIGRPLESTSHADKLLDTCTVHACKPRSSVQACQLSSSMESVLFSKNDMNENLRTKCHEKYIKETFYRKSADVQPRTRSHKLLSNVAGSTTTIYDKKRKYGAQFCQYTKDSCNLYVLHGFKFCMLHILEDCSAPYKQCDFIEKQIRVRCGFPVCLNLSDPRFCQIHRQSDNLVGEIELGSSFLNVVPAFGKFSSIMMAVTVSHHLSEKTDLWICSKSNCLPNADIFWDQQYEKPGAGWAKLFTRRISDLHHDVIEESNDSTSQEVTLVSMKANLENISRYVGWRSSVSLNSEGRTNSCLYNTGDFLDGEEEKELQTNTNNFVQKNVSQSEYKISLRFETDVEEHDSSAVQPQARRACCSKFVGVRKRPWGAYGAEICTSEGKRLWLGTFSTEKEGALAYDDAARVLRSNGAVTNFSKGQNLVRGERSDRSTEAPEQRSVLRKRGRSVGTKKYYDAYPVETSEKLLDLTHSFLDGSIEDHNLIQSRVNLLGDGIFSPGFKQGVQSLPTMKTERDFFKLEKCELPEAKQDLCLEHLNEQQISESHWSSSPCLPMETENADQHNLESSMSCLKQSILHGSCDNGKKLNGTKSLSFCQPGDRGEVHSDDSDILFTPCESKVMKELQKNFMELKEEFGSEMTHAVESEVSDITQLNGSTSFVPEGNMTIIGGFPNCNTRRNSVSPGKFQILSELNVEEKTVLSLGFCLKL
ncbi:hypothetical protein KP509_34G029900 [Ceratopteris richardii]|nr:hypothetical protein KP509_34G029900 [Ceratopteris richardii]